MEQCDEAALRTLMDGIYQRYNYDFRDYAPASQRRRVLLAVQQFGCADVPQLREQVLGDSAAFTRLLHTLTIPVTQMFRDPPFFLALRRDVLPILKTYASLKIWIAGCCTGEEVLSMAIMLREEGLLERSMMYATDINPSVLEKAKKGVLTREKIPAYTENYRLAGGMRALSDYYTAAYDNVLFDKSLYENVTFADHSLATDSVFAETQLIICRNVLIYFNGTLQNRAFALFHESLCHRGFLGLGSKESTNFSASASAFEQIDKHEKLYRKR